MKDKVKLLAINPGSTSTKIAVFENEEKILSMNITHDADKLKEFKQISDQFVYRKDMIERLLEENGINLTDIDAFVGRGGGLEACEGGTYPVNDLLLHHAKICYKAKHPATLGAVIAYDFAVSYGKKAYVVNPASMDEMDAVARITGLAGVLRESRFHALNQKEVAIRAAGELGKKYNEVNLVVAHIGGGVSVAAHRKGRVVDTTNAIGGDGPMAPTRCGQIPMDDVISLCCSGKYTPEQIKEFMLKNGGIVDHLGTSDMRDVIRRIEDGDAYAKLVYDAFIYQIGKSIGAYASVLKGKVDRIVLTGGITNDNKFVAQLKDIIEYIAPVIVYPGEFEMEALANGVLRILRGEEEAKEYIGKPVCNGFDNLK